MSDLTALKRAIAEAGSQSELARRVSAITGKNIRQGHISYWLENGVGAESIVAVSQSVEWKVTPHELDSDLYPNADDALPPELRGRRQKTRAAA